jgi:hypothetical protein
MDRLASRLGEIAAKRKEIAGDPPRVPPSSAGGGWVTADRRPASGCGAARAAGNLSDQSGVFRTRLSTKLVY